MKTYKSGMVWVSAVLLTGVMLGQQIAPNDSLATFPFPKFGSVNKGTNQIRVEIHAKGSA